MNYVYFQLFQNQRLQKSIKTNNFNFLLKHRLTKTPGGSGVIVNQISGEDICPERAQRVEGPLFNSDEGVLSRATIGSRGLSPHIRPGPLFRLPRPGRRRFRVAQTSVCALPPVTNHESPVTCSASSFINALPLRNHGRSRLCMYLGSVRFFASSFCAHSRASSHRLAVFRKLA